MGNVTPPTNCPERRAGARGGGPSAPSPEQFDPRLLVRALTAFRRGDFTVRLPDDWTGLGGKIADAFNDVIDLNQRMAREVDRLSRVVGKQGKIAERGTLGTAPGPNSVSPSRSSVHSISWLSRSYSASARIRSATTGR